MKCNYFLDLLKSKAYIPKGKNEPTKQSKNDTAIKVFFLDEKPNFLNTSK